MRKGVTPEQQKQAVRILDDLGIMMYASYMIDPSYTRDDFRGMLAYVRRLKHQYATFTVMTPLPGTELYQERKRDLLSRKPELFDMLHALTPHNAPSAGILPGAGPPLSQSGPIPDGHAHPRPLRSARDNAADQVARQVSAKGPGGTSGLLTTMGPSRVMHCLFPIEKYLHFDLGTFRDRGRGCNQ